MLSPFSHSAPTCAIFSGANPRSGCDNFGRSKQPADAGDCMAVRCSVVRLQVRLQTLVTSHVRCPAIADFHKALSLVHF